MISIRKLRVCSHAIVLGVTVLSFSARLRTGSTPQPASSNDATAAGAAAQAPRASTDGQLNLAEPDYSIVNLPTTLRLPRFGSAFHLTHRFNENLRRDDFGTQASNLFGSTRAQRSGSSTARRHAPSAGDRAADQHREDVPVLGQVRRDASIRGRAGLDFGLLSVEGDDNFKQSYAPALGAVVSREITDRAALYATPVWVHNSAGGTGLNRDTFYVGFGGRLKITETLYVTGEATP